MSKFSKDYIFTEGKTSLFHNWSDEAFPSEKFPCTWANRPIKPIPPGATVDMPQYLAFHCAKHLANREIIKNSEINKTDPILNGDAKDKYMERALIGEGRESGDPQDEISYDMVSNPETVVPEVKKEEMIEPKEEPVKEIIAKKPMGRPKKEKEVPEVKKNPDFEE